MTEAGAGYIVLQAAVLAVIFLYCRMIYGYREQAAASLKIIAPFSLLFSKKEEWGGGIENKNLYDRYTAFITVIGLFSVGIAAGKAALAAGVPPTGVTEYSAVATIVASGWLPAIAAVAAGVTAICVVSLQTLVLKAAGRLVFAGGFVDFLLALKRTCLSATILLVAPFIFMYTGENPVRDEIFIYVVIIELIAIAAMYAFHTLYLFIKQKVSLLVWFLYLCTVEIFPVSLVVLLVVKNV